MGIKRKSKVLAQFNMSSLTDIIFLLLIFFMLTSSLIVPNALNLKLPGNSSSVTNVTKQPNTIVIQRDGVYKYNGKITQRDQLFQTFRDLKRAAGKDEVNVTVSPHPKASNDYVVDVLDMAFQLNINAILTEPK